MTQIQEKQTNALNGYLMALLALLILAAVAALVFMRLIPFVIPLLLLIPKNRWC